ncbi:MAG: hypothetical protein Ct9H300mP28_32230 [Pseudomonadota bacterium]|nr:MAG: hypothetical protein Ct9H300mP28_32230 [Pseudomonadota bacterium]
MNGTVIPGWQGIKTDSAAFGVFLSYPGGIIGRISGERFIVSGGSFFFPLSGRFPDHLNKDSKLPLVRVIFLGGGMKKDYLKTGLRRIAEAWSSQVLEPEPYPIPWQTE